jgi:hypothetical protein
MQETSQNEDCGDGGNTEAQKIHALEVALMDTNKVSDMHTSHNLLLTGLIYGRYCC